MRTKTVRDRIVAGLKASCSKRVRFQCAQTWMNDEEVILMKVNRNVLFRILIMCETDEEQLQQEVDEWNQHPQMDL